VGGAQEVEEHLERGAGHRRVAHLPAWPDGDTRSRLVLIVRDLDPAFVRRLWDAFLGRGGVDDVLHPVHHHRPPRIVGQRHQPLEPQELRPRSRLVLIVRDLDPAFVRRLWDAFLGRPAVDAPDPVHHHRPPRIVGQRHQPLEPQELRPVGGAQEVEEPATPARGWS
jgi:hypothetical protein